MRCLTLTTPPHTPHVPAAALLPVAQMKKSAASFAYLKTYFKSSKQADEEVKKLAKSAREGDNDDDVLEKYAPAPCP